MKKVLTTAATALLLVAALTMPQVAAAGPGHHHGDPHSDRHPGHRSCQSPGVLFCEDFEAGRSASRQEPRWDVDADGGTLRIEREGRRNHVAHVRTDGNGRAFLTVRGLDAPDNTFYGRFRVMVDEFPTSPDWAHFTLVEVTGTGSAEVVRPFGGQFAPTVGPDATFYGVGADGGPTGDWTSWRESAPTVAGRWQCVEFSWDGRHDAIDVWLDGVAQPDLSVSRTDHGGNPVDLVLPDADTVKIGWQLYQESAESFDTFLDDIALSTRRVGC